MTDLVAAAMAAIDTGDVAELERLLLAHPTLACTRLEAPTDGFFARPYLLWFVAEDPVRNGTLPANIADVARAIIRSVARECAPTLKEQLDYALLLVSWSWIARECGVQIPLLDVLVDAGASPDAGPNNALVNGNVDAAAHLVARGAPPTLALALCLGRWEEASQLGVAATAAQKQFALTLNAMRGNAEGVRRLITMGADVNAISEHLYSHATRCIKPYGQSPSRR